MAITLSTGASISVAKTYGASITVSAATNASQTVLTTASAHSYSVGDYVELVSGWDLLDKRVVRCTTGTTGSTVVLESVDTTSTSLYPAGSGIGSIRKISAWSQLSQVKTISGAGGSQNYADVTSLSNSTQKQVPTTRSAVTMDLTVFDDPTLAWYSDVTVADQSRSPYGILMSFPNGSRLLGNAYWSMQKIPGINSNEALTTQISLSYAAEPIRYAS